jgi:hypothetical protein
VPITDQFERLPLSSIKVAEERQRTSIDTADLEDSIRQRGVVQAIIVHRGADGEAWLVAGQRRLEASRRLELPDIPVRWAESLSRPELEIIELEENIKRKDLDWQDLVRAVARLHRLYLALDSGWTMTETSAAIGLTLGAVSMYLRVASELGQPRIVEAGSIREAYNVLARKDAREAGSALEELLEPTSMVFPPAQVGYLPVQAGGPVLNGGVEPTPPPPPIDPILNLSFLEWAPLYSGPKFNLIHCDFPYGNEVEGPQLVGAAESFYKNQFDLYISLLECLCRNLPRLASFSTHLMFWCSSEILSINSPYARETYNLFAMKAPQVEFSKFPLIWIKSDNAGIASDPRRTPRHVYEVALLASIGNRQLVKATGDAYSAPTDRRLHPSAKPEPMLRHFMSMLVDDTSSVLDPTAGSGAALRAADSLGARHVLGLEIDEGHCRVANQAFRGARMLRSASRGLD